MADERMGKMLRKPSPKCIECSNYLVVAWSFNGEQIWHCTKCNATYEKKKDE